MPRCAATCALTDVLNYDDVTNCNVTFCHRFIQNFLRLYRLQEVFLICTGKSMYDVYQLDTLFVILSNSALTM